MPRPLSRQLHRSYCRDLTIISITKQKLVFITESKIHYHYIIKILKPLHILNSICLSASIGYEFPAWEWYCQDPV